ncbi:MAG: DHH family phosphoesterase, partial [Candidatus Micrarchaeota archaeon]
FSMSNPLIVHHYDCDGITSGSIVADAFRSKSKKYRQKWIKKLDDSVIDELKSSKEKEIIFVDLGGGNKRVNELDDVLVIDHHQTEGIDKLQINPLLFGVDGGEELSAAGTTSLVFDHREDLGIVGAVGDMQHPLKGANRFLLEKAVKKQLVNVEHDLCFYGRFSRPIIQFLMYSDDPYIPGLSYDEAQVIALLNRLGIKMKNGDGDRDRWRTYSDLSKEEKMRLVSELANMLLNQNQIKKAEDLIQESYLMANQPKDTEMYEANEFSTLLNACGRHGKAEIGVSVCLGDKGAYDKARELLSLHRRMIKDGIEYAKKNVQDFGKFYFLDARGIIDEGIIGIICGMYLHPASTKPMIGISDGDEDTLKLSSRGTKKLIAEGLNLSAALHEVTEIVGGVGGGHRIAAGASFPKAKINEFLSELGLRFLS